MKIVTAFLDSLRISYNNQTVRNFFATHPYHPSMTSISDLLDEFNIENAGIAIGKENFSQIPVPFIAKTSSSDGDFCLITTLNNGEISYLNEKNIWVKETLEQFFTQYSGIVLVAEKEKQSGEPEYIANKKTYRQKNIALFLSVILACLFFIIAFIQNTTWSFSSIALFVLKLAGLAASILLLIQSHDANNPFINKLCSSGSGNGCNSILSSSSAKIFGGKISWSEVGLFYFLSTLSVLCFSPNNEAAINLLGLFNFCALPYTVYSIWHQYKVAKQWCRLCLSVQGILWLEFFSIIFVFHLQHDISAYRMPLLILIGSFALSIAIWLLLKPFVIQNQQIAKLQRDINLFRKDENIFYTLLKEQREATPIDQSTKIVLGNPAAAFEITFVSNPFCMPCAKMHNALHPVLEECRNELLLNLVFTASSNPDDPKNEIIKILIATYLNKDRKTFELAINEWFNKGIDSPKTWIDKYKQEENDSILKTFEAHKNWCEENNITHTPTLFFNNHLHLSEYSFDDLKYFIHQSAKATHGATEMA